MFLITEIEEELVTLIINELVNEKKIVKINNNEYMLVEKIQKRRNHQIKKGNIGFIRASRSFMIEAEQKCTSSTFKSYKSTLNKHLIPFFNDFRIVNIKPENIDQFIEQKLDEGLSHKSIDNIVKLLGSILEKALKDRYIPFNPARAVRRF